MSLWILDTDTLSLLQRGDAEVTRRVLLHDPRDVSITVITATEQIEGRFKSIHSAKGRANIAIAYSQLAATLRSVGRMPILDFSEQAQIGFDSLVAMKLNVGRNDLRIAAIALELKATVITRNQRDFGRVAGLPLEDWSIPLPP